MGPTARIPLTFCTQITKHTAGSANWGASGQYSLPKTQWNRLENHAISGRVAGLQNLKTWFPSQMRMSSTITPAVRILRRSRQSTTVGINLP